MTIQVENSNEYHHVKWIELKPGQLTECAVLKVDEYGNMYHFPIADLDMIDRRRLLKILTDRHAASMELWDLMSQKTLGNGMNALNYFHQLVKIVTPEGKIINPRAGVIGRSAGTRATNPATNPADDAAPAAGSSAE
jgi:hypothetical protein